MAKTVFRPTEVINLTSSVQVDPPEQRVAEAEVVDDIPEYRGPTADDLRREAEAFKASWEEEKASMLKSAEAEAETIIKQAEQKAFDEVKRRTDAIQKEKQLADDQVKKTKQDAESQAATLVQDAEAQVAEIKNAAHDEGFEAGRVEGYESGHAEAERLIEQLHSIINNAIEKRNEIIEESETQLINLVLLIARKVIKVISENQKNVVINNVIQALRKLKSRGEVIIKVNLEDVQLTSEHIKDFMRMVENVKSITVVEDSSVDRGGCIIETDFGQIDARISSQLHEIEEKVIELTPIKIVGEE